MSNNALPELISAIDTMLTSLTLRYETPPVAGVLVKHTRRQHIEDCALRVQREHGSGVAQAFQQLAQQRDAAARTLRGVG